jgi:predicted RNA binding protein YcfA (HicA-like mRNA interferase family)
MRVPREVSGEELRNGLEAFGSAVTRQTGGHLRLTAKENGEHHITIPKHTRLMVETLASILTDITSHFGLSRTELSEKLFR